MSIAIEERKQILNAELKRIADALIKQYYPDKIILFGSLAADNVHEWSDIDLAIIKDTSKRFLDRLDDALFIVNPKVGLNLLIYTPQEFESMLHENQYFVTEEILKKGKVLYAKV